MPIINRIFACFAFLLTLIAYSPKASAIETIMAVGDSLVAGYGLPKAEGFTNQLESALQAIDPKYKVINAGVSGDTSKGGQARLEWLLANKPDLVILELGANDGLRGLPPAQTKENLDKMLTLLGDRNIPVVFAGMLAPPNLGKDYGAEFNAIFPDLAEKHGVTFFPFFLEGVAGEVNLNQADGIHPNKEGVAVVVETILPYILKTIESAQ